MNWSLNFGPPTWDVVVVHPAVIDRGSESSQRDDLIRRLVNAQDLSLIDCPASSTATAQEIIQTWFENSSKKP